MLDFIKNIFKKSKKYDEEYVSCKQLQGGITFMPNVFRTCCSNKEGVTFVDNYKGEPINWKEIEKTRKQIIENCKKGILPENCKGCVDLRKQKWNDNKIFEIYIHHWDHCNCGCVYCVAGSHASFLEKEKRPSDYYNVYNHLKEMYKHNMISDNVHVEIIGGELTVLDEAEDIINLVLDHNAKMSFHSSCIFYSPGIERALKEAPYVDLDFALDCGDRELYKKIKRIDAYDQVISNLKRYLASTERAKDSITAKYIIVDGLNDNVTELDKWINIINELGIKKAKVEINFKRFFSEFHHKDPTVPPHYYEMYEHFKKRIAELGIQDCCWEYSKRVLEEGGIPKDYQQKS